MYRDILEMRWKPLWTCSNCGYDIYATDMIWSWLLRPARTKAETPIYCPKCGHVDLPGEVRNYSMESTYDEYMD